MDDWQEQLIKSAQEIIQHGHGELRFTAEETKNLKTKIVIHAGKSYCHFVKKEVDLSKYGTPML